MVTVMTVVILMGLGFVAYGLLVRGDGSGERTETARSFGTVVLDQPAGTRIADVTGTGHHMLLHLEGGEQRERIAVIDLSSGRVLGFITVAPVP